jgi:hypothetical protein
VIATHGRGFWILDGVTPLRQADQAAAASGVWLFAPAVAVRLRPAGFTGTPLPKDEPMSANPPAGAFIDYAVKGPLSGALTLTILDAQGGLVRGYGSDDKPPATDLTKIRIAPEWVSPPAALSTAPGMHRFVWPLRYPAPPSLAEGSAFSDGVWAAPGRYTVELAGSGQKQSQPLTIVPDPRVSLGPEDYARQFALARRVDVLRGRVAAAVDEAEKAHRALVERGLMDLDRQVLALTGPQFGERPVGPPPKGVSTLRSLAEGLSTLASAVDGADAAPSPDAEAGYAKLAVAVDAALAAWEELRRLTAAPPS